MQNGLPGTLGRRVCHAVLYRQLSIALRHALPSAPGVYWAHRAQRSIHTTTAATADEPIVDNEQHVPSKTKKRGTFTLAKQPVSTPRLWRDLVTETNAAKLIGIFREINESFGDVPLPILREFVERPYLPPALLLQLMEYVRKRHSDVKLPPSLLSIWYERLLFHAREVSPESMEFATDILLNWFPTNPIDSSPEAAHAAKKIRQRTDLLNNAMEWLATAPKIRPYASSAMQESQLFRLLQHMAEHDPPLHVNRKGYRAVVRVQLRLPKTESEQHWASLKALSWPPWKQDRNALDSELDPEDGLSKAKSTLLKQASAGYPEDDWDKVASVYAGQETDGTPTVQTRRDMLGHLVRRLAASSLWVARIAATRTIQEAWMIWLEYCDVSKRVQQNDVALAILMRLHQEELRLRTEEPGRGLPGDGLEIHKPPASVHLHTYTRSAPPSVHQFFDTMFAAREAAGLKISTALGAYFVANASSFEHACEYLTRLGRWYYGIGHIMTTDVSMCWTNKGLIKIEKLPARLRTAAVIALCRFVNVPNRKGTSIPDSGLQRTWQEFELSRHHNFVRAVWLAQRLPPERQAVPWRAILRVLSDTCNNVRMQYLARDVAMMTSDRSTVYPELSADERIRFRYDMLTIQAYKLMLQVTELINKSMALDVHMLFEFTTMTAHCAWSCLATLSQAVDQDRGEVLTKVYESSGLMPAIDSFLGSRPEHVLMQMFEKAAGITGETERAIHSDDADDLFIDESSGEMHYNSSTAFFSISPSDIAEEGTKPTTKSNVRIDAAHFHQWIRALGLLGRHDAMLRLLRQICADDTIGVLDDTGPRYMRMLRSAVIAVQVFLERPYLDQKLMQRLRGKEYEDSQPARQYLKLCEEAPPEMVEEARSLLLARFGESMGSWPTPWESEQYCVAGHLGTKRGPEVI